MRRALLLIAFLTTGSVTTIPALVFYFGCCVLPFHRVLHRMLPLCAMTRVRPEPTDQLALPAAKTISLLRAVPVSRVIATPLSVATEQPLAIEALRRSITTNAASRCDEDVGLYTLLSTFII